MDDDQRQIFPGDPAGKSLGLKIDFRLMYLMLLPVVNVSEKGKINLGSTGH
jgi:hypothetical protein